MSTTKQSLYAFQSFSIFKDAEEKYPSESRKLWFSVLFFVWFELGWFFGFFVVVFLGILNIFFVTAML